LVNCRTSEEDDMDLRDLVEMIRKEGQLVEIDEEVSWNLEAPAYTAMAYRVENGKGASLFNNVRGYKGKGRIFGGAYASSRKRSWERSAIIFGMDRNTSWPAYREEFMRRIEHPLKPIVVETGDAPCKDNVMLGKDVNLLNFPWPYIHQVDGGRYGTVQTMIVEDPDTGWVNWGNYRVMIVSKNRATGLFVFGQHGPTIFYTKWEPRNEPCPFALAVGGDPAILYAAGLPLPAGVCEADYAGGLREEPLRVVRCETNKLFVPADAELVIEGVIAPQERLDEGPTGEYTGYVHSRSPMPVYHVQCITHRENPILPMSVEGVSFNDNMSVFGSVTGAEFYHSLKQNGFPITEVRGLNEASYGSLVVATEVPYEGYIQELRNFIDSHKITIWGTMCVFVDADVDISGDDMAEKVYQELSTKIDPARDIYRTDNDVLATPLSPMVDAQGRLTGVGGARVVWDATTPRNWTKREKIKAADMEDLFPASTLKDAEKVYEGL
jgi:UbiD family decarboxylase